MNLTIITTTTIRIILGCRLLSEMRSRYEGSASISVKDNPVTYIICNRTMEQHQQQHQHQLQCWCWCFSLQHQICCKARLELHTVGLMVHINSSHPGYHKGL